MPQYAIIVSHPPDICPLTNKRVREFAKKMAAEIPGLQEKLGIKTISDLHLDPGHKGVSVYEAPNAEALRDYLVQAGYMHYTQIEFYLVTPIAELLKHADDFPTIYE